MKKKGFTLVELLAVIAILAILVIMALPAVLRMFNSARKDSFTNEVNTVIRTARQQYLLSGGQAQSWSNAEGSTNKLNLTGNSELNYCITINGEGQITELKATNGSYKYESNGIIDQTSSSDIETAESGYTLSCSVESETHISTCVEDGCDRTVVGTELILVNENFYVVSSNSSETVLLAKYVLKPLTHNTYTQSAIGPNTSVLEFTFLNNNNIAYWDGQQCLYNSGWSCTGTPAGLISPYSDGGKVYCISPLRTNCAYVYDSNVSKIYQVVNKYADRIGSATNISITGRLMTLDEAYSLSTEVRRHRNGSSNYWLGTAYNRYHIWSVTSNGRISDDDASIKRLVRPVIVVPTSEL